MNYYPHHIGDFNSATRHLTRTERSVYRDLLEVYYDTEAQLSSDINKLCRLVLAHTDEERTAVEQVLNEFFTQTEQGWMHARCETEIARYHGNKEAKSAAGKASAAKRAQKSKAKHNEPPPSSEQTSNTRPTAVDVSLGVCATNQNQNQNQINTSSLRSDGACEKALAAKAMRAVGLQTANPSDPRLAKLLGEGVTIDELTYVAAEAVRLGKPFAYALAMAAGRREDAAKLQVGKPPGRRTPQPENFENKNYGQGVELV